MDHLVQTLSSALESVFGGGPDEVSFWQLLLRTLLIYVGGLALVRLGRRRFMGEYSAFDMILGVTIGALLSTAASDGPTFANAVAIVCGLIALHWLLSTVTFRSEAADRMLKGDVRRLVRDGELDQKELRRAAISRSELDAALRRAGVELEQVEGAFFERSGDISICPADQEPHVVEVEVQPGVQCIRIEIVSPSALIRPRSARACGRDDSAAGGGCARSIPADTPGTSPHQLTLPGA